MSLYWGHGFEDFGVQNDDDLQDDGIHFQIRLGTAFWDPTLNAVPEK